MQPESINLKRKDFTDFLKGNNSFIFLKSVRDVEQLFKSMHRTTSVLPKSTVTSTFRFFKPEVILDPHILTINIIFWYTFLGINILESIDPSVLRSC